MSGLDGFTAGVLLSCLSSGCDVNEVATITNNLKSGKKNPPSAESIAWFTEHQGKRVTTPSGVVCTIKSLNTSDCGFYPGGDFPIYVEEVESGKVYEFHQRFLTLI